MSTESFLLEAGQKIVESIAPVVERGLSGHRVDLWRELVFRMGELIADEIEARKFGSAPTDPASADDGPRG
jgi:hypothetical protein